MGQNFSIIFSSYLLEERASTATAAWILNTQRFLWNALGILIHPLATEFGWRQTAFLGCLACSTSLVLSAFTPSPEFLFFSHSLLSGEYCKLIETDTLFLGTGIVNYCETLLRLQFQLTYMFVLPYLK